MSGLKVLVTGSTFPKYEGDSAPRFVLDTCKALQNSGLNVLALVPHAQGSRYTECLEGVNVIRYPYFWPSALEQLSGEGIMAKLKQKPIRYVLLPFLLLSQLLFTAFLLVKFRPSSLLVNWIVPQGVVARLLKVCFWRLKYVVVVHGGDAALITKNRVFRGLGKSVFEKAVAVVAVSTFIRDKVTQVAGSKSIDVISMGVNFREYESIAKDIDIAFVGRLEEKKGVTYLIKAVQLLTQSGYSPKCIIVGGGSMESVLVTEAKQMRLQNHIEFVGAKPHAEVIEILARAKTFVLPSINLTSDFEGMPTVLLEAMSQRAAVIATDAGGVKDLIVHDVNGYLVGQKDAKAIAEALETLLGNERKRKQLTNQARELVLAEYTYPHIAEKFRRVLDRN